MSLEARVRALLSADDVDGAASEAIRGLGPDVLRYLHSILRDPSAADDAFSQFAEALWKGLHALRRDASLRGWAFRIAFHVALNVREESWRRRGRGFATGEASKIADEVRTKTVIRDERNRRAFERLRAALSMQEQSLLALRIDQELSWAEIAESVSAEGKRVEPAALMKRFERLKKRLAEIAREEGLVD